MQPVPVLHRPLTQIQALLRLIQCIEVDREEIVLLAIELVGTLTKDLHAALVAEIPMTLLRSELVVRQFGLCGRRGELEGRWLDAEGGEARLLAHGAITADSCLLGQLFASESDGVLGFSAVAGAVEVAAFVGHVAV